MARASDHRFDLGRRLGAVGATLKAGVSAGVRAGAAVGRRAGAGLVRAITGGHQRPRPFAEAFYDELQAIAFLRWRRRPSSSDLLDELRELRRVIGLEPTAERQERLEEILGTIQRAQDDEEIALAERAAELQELGPESQVSLAHHLQLRGLAFSGGGIRSAAFSLGVLRALAKMDLLRRFDYLSTVSGGGYAGSWLATLIQRRGRRRSEEAVRREADEPGSPVGFVRAYSNFLTPRTGLLSLDTWMAAATYARNLVLNLVVLGLALSCAVLVLWLVGSLVLLGPGAPGALDPPRLLVPAAMLLLLAVVVITWNLEPRIADRVSFAARPGSVVGAVVAPLFAAGTLLSLWLADVGFAGPPRLAAGRGGWLLEGVVEGRLWAWVCGAAALYLGCWLAAAFIWWMLRLSLDVRDCLWGLGRWTTALISALVAGALGGGGVWLLARLAAGAAPAVPDAPTGGRWLEVLTWGPPLTLGVLVLTGVFHIGLMGRAFPEASREWWSRLGGWLGLLALLWIAAFGICFYSPPLFEWLRSAELPLLEVLGVGWLAATVTGVLAARGDSPDPGGKRRSLRLLTRGAPYAFVAGLVGGLSYAIYRLLPPLLERVGPKLWWVVERVAAPGFERPLPFAAGRPPAAPELAAQVDASLAWTADALAGPGQLGEPARFVELAVLLLGLSLLALVVSWRVDINEFSMHLFYRNRLVRAYLGASRERRPVPFTGFDSGDDLPLESLSPSRPGLDPTYDGPLPLFNTSLNLTAGEELAWQERRASSFVISPLHYGFVPSTAHAAAAPGIARGAFRSTAGANQDGGISIGTAMAISGAAVNPNMGHNSSPALAFLMTVFNVRLGWWLGNPGHASPRIWQKPAPRVGLLALLSELLGRSSARGRYVHLSDGGHFDNLGVYELVRRRCRLIVTCDAEADPDLEFGSLGSLIRRCRSDFGAEIEIDVSKIRKAAETGTSGWHCAVGRIHYPEGISAKGTLVYLKASLTGDESSDLLNYADCHRGFPHESTADQWFDEAQFESYRKLGYHVAMSALGDAVFISPEDDRETDMERIVRRWRQRWVAPLATAEGALGRHTARLAELFERLRTTDALGFLDQQIYPEWNSLATGGPSGAAAYWLPEGQAEIREGFYFCNQLIQLMERVYVDAHLERESDHPDNRGWMNLFKHWSWSGMFQATWAVSACTFGHRFQAFCERRLGLAGLFAVELTEVPLEPAAARRDGGAAAVAAALAGSRHLNVLERDMVARFLDAEPEGADRLWVAEVVVRDQLPGPGEGRRELRFGCGFALTRDQVGDGDRPGHDGDRRDRPDRRLGAYRIQDHLRRMGLGRKGLLVLVREHDLHRWPRWIDPVPGEYAAEFPQRDRQRCADLLTSVSFEIAEGAADGPQRGR